MGHVSWQNSNRKLVEHHGMMFWTLGTINGREAWQVAISSYKPSVKSNLTTVLPLIIREISLIKKMIKMRNLLPEMATGIDGFVTYHPYTEVLQSHILFVPVLGERTAIVCCYQAFDT